MIGSYLELASEGVGRGYLFPASAGCETFFTLAFRKLIPDLLPKLPPAERAAALAACFNLGENLEGAPPWLRRIFLRMAGDLSSLSQIPELVSDVTRRAVEPPEALLGRSPRLAWIDLAAEDRRFLPGALHFLAPTVLCVHDRLRTRAGTRPPVTLGVWIVDPPLSLGPLGCIDTPVVDAAPRVVAKMLQSASGKDPRITERHSVAANDWRAAAALVTSQQLVALLPERC